MQRVTNGQTVGIGVTGPFCAIAAVNPSGPPAFVQGSPNSIGAIFKAFFFYAYGNSGLTAVTLQAQSLEDDGTYRDYGPSINGTGPGYIAGVQVWAPLLGGRWNITSAPTGGTIWLACRGLIV